MAVAWSSSASLGLGPPWHNLWALAKSAKMTHSLQGTTAQEASNVPQPHTVLVNLLIQSWSFTALIWIDLRKSALMSPRWNGCQHVGRLYVGLGTTNLVSELSLQVHWASHSGVHLMCFHCLGRIRKIWQEVGGTGRTTPFATRTCSFQDKSVDVDARAKETQLIPGEQISS